MASVRCRRHTPNGRTRNYTAPVLPVGYPNAATICGSFPCRQTGLIWLDESERRAFDRGERVFQGPTNALKFRAAD